MRVEYNLEANTLKIIFSRKEEDLYERIVFLTANSGTPCEPRGDEVAAWMLEVDDLLIVFSLTED